MRLADFRVLTFDGDGTPIDRETGIHAALWPLLRRAGGTTRMAGSRPRRGVFAWPAAARRQRSGRMPVAMVYWSPRGVSVTFGAVPQAERT